MMIKAIEIQIEISLVSRHEIEYTFSSALPRILPLLLRIPLDYTSE